jgi:hypothetical protein
MVNFAIWWGLVLIISGVILDGFDILLTRTGGLTMRQFCEARAPPRGIRINVLSYVRGELQCKL